MSNFHNKDKSTPNDMLGQPLQRGDFVAFPVGKGSSGAGTTVGLIEEIIFRRRVNGRGKVCEPHQADYYTLRIKPYQSTGYYDRQRKYHPDGFTDPVTGDLSYFEDTGEGVKSVSIQKVENVVKLNVGSVRDAYTT